VCRRPPTPRPSAFACDTTAKNKPPNYRPAMVSQLALDASSRDQKISDLAKDLLRAVTMKGLIDEVLKE
jgi:hypothetical protein